MSRSQCESQNQSYFKNQQQIDLSQIYAVKTPPGSHSKYKHIQTKSPHSGLNHGEFDMIIQLQDQLAERDRVIDLMKNELVKYRQNSKIPEMEAKIKQYLQQNQNLSQIVQTNIDQCEEWKQKYQTIQKSYIQGQTFMTSDNDENIVIKQLKQQLEIQIFEKSEFETKIYSLESQLQDYQKKILQVNTENFSFMNQNDKINQLQTQLKTEQEKSQEKSLQIDELKNQLTNTKTKLLNQNQENQQKRPQTPDNLVNREQKIRQTEQELQSKQAQLEFKLANQIIDNQSKKKISFQLQAKIDELQKQILSIFTQYDAQSDQKYMQTRSTSQSKKQDELKKQKNLTKNTFKQIQELNDKLTSMYKDTDTVSTIELNQQQLENNTNQYSLQNEQLRAQNIECKRQIENLLKEIDRMNKIQLASEQTETQKEVKEIVEKYENKLNENQQDEKKLQLKLENDMKYIKEQEEQIKNLIERNKELSELAGEIEEIKGKYEALQFQKDILETDKLQLLDDQKGSERLINDLSNVDSENKKLQKELDDLKQEIEALQNSKNELMIKLTSSNGQQLNLQETITTIKNEFEKQVQEYRKKNNDLTRELNSKNEQFQNHLSQQKADSKQMNSQLYEQIRDLQTQLKEKNDSAFRVEQNNQTMLKQMKEQQDLQIKNLNQQHQFQLDSEFEKYKDKSRNQQVELQNQQSEKQKYINEQIQYQKEQFEKSMLDKNQSFQLQIQTVKNDYENQLKQQKLDFDNNFFQQKQANFNQIDKIEDQLRQQQTLIHTLESTIEQLQAKLIDSQNQVIYLENAIQNNHDSQKSDSQNVQQYVQKLQQKYAQDSQELRQRYQLIQDQIINNEKKNSGDIEAERLAYKVTIEQLKSLQTSIQKPVEKHIDFNDSKENELNIQLNNANERIFQIENENKQFSCQIQSYKQEKESMNKFLQDRTQEINDLLGEIKDLKQNNQEEFKEKYNKQKDQLQQKYNEKFSVLVKSQSEVGELNQQLITKIKDLDTAKNQYLLMTNSIASLQSKLVERIDKEKIVFY